MHESDAELAAAIPQEHILAHLDRILASAAFKDAPKLRDILSFVVRETLNGRGPRIKEYTISLDVYRKASSHDSSRNSIIRTAIGRLRAKLQIYYGTEAPDDGVLIEIPRGEYRPIFRLQHRKKSLHGDSASCAVLPFRDFRGADSGSQLAENLADELIHTLSYVRGLRVISRTSSFAFRNTTVDVVAIARRLGVTRVIEGSLRSFANETELAVAIIDAADGSISWSCKFSGPHDELLTIQRRMTKAIIAALESSPLEDNRLSKTSLAAWLLYRQGRFHAERRTAEGWAKSIECFQQALKKDPAYALAHAGFADAHILLANFGEMKSSAAMSIARESAEAALAIDPKLAEAHTSMGAVKMFMDWNWTGAEQEYRLALQLSPSYAQGHHWYSRYLSFQLRAGEAQAEMEAALSLDPVSPGTHVSAGMVAFEARRFDHALKHFRDALDLTENHPYALWQMGLTEIELGRSSAGLELMERARKSLLASYRLWSCIGYAHAKAGNEKQALQWLKRLQLAARTAFVSPLDIALVRVGLGQLDQAFALIEQAIAERDNFLCWLSSAQYWKILHNDARFRAAAKLIGLPCPK